MNAQKALNGQPSLRVIFILLITAGCGIFFSACHHATRQTTTVPPVVPKPKNPSVIELLTGSGTKTFRDVSFGDTPETVKKSEKKDADEVDANYISYTFPLDTVNADSADEEIDSLNYFTVAYNFDRQKLNEIDEDIYLPTDSLAADMARRLTDYFTGKYGGASTGSDAQVWSFTSNHKKIKITLSDQSAEYDYGKLYLVVYCEDY